MAEEEKKLITREKHPGCIAHGHKLAALLKKRKEEILHNKEQSAVQPTEQSTVQSTVQSIEQPSVQSTVQSIDTYAYGVGILAVLAIGVCVFLLHTTLFNLKIKNKPMKNRINHQNDVMSLGLPDVFACLLV